MEKEAQAEYAELLRRLYEALATLNASAGPPRPCPVYAGDESEGYCRDGGHYPIPGWEVHPCGAPATAPILHAPEMDTRPMKTINLKKYTTTRFAKRTPLWKCRTRLQTLL